MKTLYCTLTIIRHGESLGNLKDVQGGDPDLSEKGITQAKELQQKLNHIDASAIFTSDLLRARRTAEIINQERKLALISTKILRERHYGVAEGKEFLSLTQDLKDALVNYQTLTARERRTLRPVPEMENDDELAGRFITFLREIAVGYARSEVIVVCHGDLMKTLLVHTGFADHNELPWGAMENASYIIVECDGVEFKLRQTHGIRKLRPTDSPDWQRIKSSD